MPQAAVLNERGDATALGITSRLDSMPSPITKCPGEAASQLLPSLGLAGGAAESELPEASACLKTSMLPGTADRLAQSRRLDSTKTADSLATFSQSFASIRPLTCSQSSVSMVASENGSVVGANRPRSHRKAPMTSPASCSAERKCAAMGSPYMAIGPRASRRRRAALPEASQRRSLNRMARELRPPATSSIKALTLCFHTCSPG